MAEKILRSGTVIVTDLGGLGKKIFHSRDKVTERNFPPDNFDSLVKRGYIKEDEYPEGNKPQMPSPIIDEPMKLRNDEMDEKLEEKDKEKKDPLSDMDFGRGNKSTGKKKGKFDY